MSIYSPKETLMFLVRSCKRGLGEVVLTLKLSYLCHTHSVVQSWAYLFTAFYEVNFQLHASQKTFKSLTPFSDDDVSICVVSFLTVSNKRESSHHETASEAINAINSSCLKSSTSCGLLAKYCTSCI